MVDRNGDELVLFLPMASPAPLAEYPDVPIVFACIVARYQGRVLYVYNSHRLEWELPSGMIEAGETPLEAALRELKEESGQVAEELRFAGMCLLRLHRQQIWELGAIYTCELDALLPFEANTETANLIFWDGKTTIEGYMNPLGLKLAQLAFG